MENQLILQTLLLKTKPEFQRKFISIVTNTQLLDKLRQEPPINSNSFYNNKLVEFSDSFMLELDAFAKKPEREELLYRQLEPFMDDILLDNNV